MHAALVEELRVGGLGRLRDWLEERQAVLEILGELPMWNSSRLPHLTPTNRRLAGRSELTVRELSAQLPAVSGEPGGAALLFLYLLLRVEEEWQISYHFRPLLDTLRGARSFVSDHWLPPEGADGSLTRAVLALMASLDAQIVAENAMTTGETTARQAALETAAASAREAFRTASEAAGEYPDLSAYCIERANQCEVFSDALATATGGIRAFFDSGRPLDAATAVLSAAEGDRRISDDTYRSDLRTQRFTLAALGQCRQERWLRVDGGKLVHLFPFAVRGIPVETVLARVTANAPGWSIAGTRCRVPYASLDLDDIWDGSDPLGRRYDGVLVSFPDILIKGSEGDELGRAGAQIRFSTLGNHYVRFDTDIQDATAADVFTAMFRTTPEHGAVQVSFDGAAGGQWSGLAELAVRLAEEVGDRLREDGDTADVRTTVRPGTFQIVLTVHAASTALGPTRSATRRELSTAADLMEAVGAQVLTNPTPYSIGAVAEWIRYSTRNELSTSTTSGVTGARTVRTSNTTVFIGLGDPTFTHGTMRSLAEFAASLDGLCEGWSLDLAEHLGRVRGFQHRVDAAERDGSSSDVLSALSRDLEMEKIRLDHFAASFRSVTGLIESPSLVASGSAADSLHMLLNRSGFPQRVAALNVQIDQVAQEQLALAIEKLAQQRRDQEAREREEAAREEDRLERAQQAKLEMFLAVIAAAGISGVVQVLQAGFFESRTAAEWAVASVVVIMTVAMILGILFWPRTRRRP
jgi:hypothetical protein